MSDPTDRQLGLMRHALGISEDTRTSYRNYFAASPNCDDHAEWLTMVENGYATNHGPKPHYADLVFFSVTEKGEILARRFAPRPKLTKSQARYRAYLDADMGCSFREYLMLKRGAR
jgi:hypothetical protein